MNNTEHEKKHNPCSCDGCCENCHSHEEEESRLSLIILAVSAVLVILSLIPMNVVLRTIFGIVAVLLSAYPIIIKAGENFKKFSLSEIELMLIAIIAACALGEFREAAAVAILYRVGEILEDKAVQRSRKNIDEVAKIQQDFANLLMSDGSVEKVRADSVEIGSEIRVMPYERFPIDGIVTDGISTADASAVTGESIPVDIEKGVEVKSGTVNGSGTVTVRTTAAFADSTASRIISMVEEASERKGKTQKAITKFARYYTPAVVGIAVAVAIIGSIASHNPAEWVRRALVLLVASCPCALVISIPLGFYSGLGAAAKKGIIVKGSAYAEAFANARAAVFDKTGTLTTDVFEIEKITALGGLDEKAVLTLAAAAEHFSSHPIAKSIVAAAPKLNEALLSDFTEIAGGGTSVVLGGRKITCGSKKLLAGEGIDVSELGDGEVCVAVGSRAVGTISLRSCIRDSAVEMISLLKEQGIEDVIMLTGDSEAQAERIANACGVDEYYCELLPGDKVELLEDIKNEHGKTVFVGDGINDAPVLAAADAGIAMGLGTQAANEAADIILTNNDLSGIAPAHKLFRQTVSAMKFNIIFALAVKLIVLLLGVFGAAPIWLAVFADVGVCLICVAVSSMIGKDIKNKQIRLVFHKN